ncbi:MAG TPA: hypothetical protein VLH10_04755 [Yinghuangia sp.]|nr:hypothetical protein [Yinghuangia sp.]
MTIATALTACGQLDSRRHAFPDSVYDPAPTPAATGIAADSGPADASPRPSQSGAVDPGEPYADLSAAELLDRSETASHALRTVRMVADLTADDGRTMRIDLVIDLEEEAYTGTVTVGGVNVEVRLRGADAWLRGGKAYWQGTGAPADVARRLADKYVHFPETHQRYEFFANLLGVGDPTFATGEFSRPRRLPVRDHDGETVIPVEARSGAAVITILLSVDRGLVPVSVADDESTSFEYSEHDRPVTVARPPAAQVVSADELSGDVDLPGV